MKAKKTQQKHKKKGPPLNRRFISAGLMLGAYLVIYLVSLMVITPTRYNLKAGDIAKTTITASKDVVDEVTTKQRRDNAASQVQPVYYRDEEVDATVLESLESAMDELERVQAYGALLSGEEEGEAEYTGEQLEEAAQMLRIVKLNDSQLQTLLGASEAELETLRQNLLSGVKTTLNGTIPEGQTTDAINNIQQLVGYTMRSELWTNVAVPTLRACLRPNMVINQDATEENREKARAEIEPLVFKQGQNIVVAGERVTTAQIALLGSLGLLEGNQFDIWMYLGVGLLALMILVLMTIYLRLFARNVLTDIKTQILLLTIFIWTLLLCLLVNLLDAYAVPTALGVLLSGVLLGTPIAMGINVMQSLLMGMFSLRVTATLTSQAFAVVLISMIGGMVGLFFIRKKAQRSSILLAGLYVGIANFFSTLAVGMITNNDFSGIFRHALYSLGGGVLSSVLCVGLQPALEAMFNLVTPSKLLELSNPNNPLLRRLMIEAPGTYHHSMIVANIAEAAAEAIGANPLLVRVGAYFHDIGKLKRPMYFKENQMGENPHDHTDPYVSKEILLAHVSDGLDLGQKYHLPEPILDMIAQHHGDTPVMYFYHKAMQTYPDREVDVKDFRYSGPRPQTAEAALVMLADTVEAAIRSMPETSPEQMAATVKKLIRGKIEDEQLEHSPLTFYNITQITEAFLAVLSGVFHERIEYPQVELPAQKAMPSPPAPPPEAPPQQPKEESEQSVSTESKDADEAAKPAEETKPKEAHDAGGAR